MTAYEIYLLFTSFFGALTAVSIISAFLNEGSARATALLGLISVGFYFMTKRNSEGLVSTQDIPGAIGKALSYVIG